MDTLLLKLVLTPALIGGASLAARRWGHAISGWLVGLPLTSGPIAFFLALERGASFAAAAAVGSLAGAIAEAAFCLAYAAVAVRVSWPIALAFGTVAFAVVAAAFPQSALSVVIAGASASVSLTVFAHRANVASAMEVLRGLLLGLFAFAAFFVVLAALIERAGIAAAFAAAIVSALAIQAVSFALGVRSAPERS